MNKMVFAGVAILALAACGGGGSSPAPIPHPSPTAAPSSQKRLVVTWNGAGQSGTALDFARRVMSGSVQTSPVTLGAAPTATAAPGQFYLGPTVGNPTMATGVITVAEVDASGSPVPVSNASFSIANTNAVTTTKNPSATPPPNDARFYVQSTATSTAATSAAITTSDASGTVNMTVYPWFVADGLGKYTDSSRGYKWDASGNISSTPDCSTADICVTSPVTGSATKVSFPYGYEVVTGALLANQTTVPTLPFVSAGNAVNVSDASWLTGVYFAKTGLGNFVAIQSTLTQCSGDQALCDNDGSLIALWKWSATGPFNT